MSYPPLPRKTNEDMTIACQQLQALQALPLYQLPTELVLQVLQLLEVSDYPAIISATLPLLRRCNIVQNMSTARLRLLLMDNRRGFFTSLSQITDRESEVHIPPVFEGSILDRLSPTGVFFPHLANVPKRLRGDFNRLPIELNILIFQQLSTLDKISLVLACYRFSDDEIESMTHQKVYG